MWRVLLPIAWLVCLLPAEPLAPAADADPLGHQPKAKPDPPPRHSPPPESPPSKPDPGFTAAQSYCQKCHLLPDPAGLDRATWAEELLPKMRYFNGLTAPTTNAFRDLDVLLSHNVFPTAPQIPDSAWRAITNYYLSKAPETISGPTDQQRIRVGLKHFETVPARFRRSPPLTTMVRVLGREGLVISGDATYQGIDFLDRGGSQVASVNLGNIPVGFAETPRGYYFAAIGHFFPRDEPRGQVILLEKRGDGLERKVLLEGLPRTSDIQVADLNGDGREDFALCIYGNFIGRFSWFEATPAGGQVEHVLIDKPGALCSVIHDFNGDGRPDLAVLLAQAEESFSIFLNEGGGRFTRHPVFQRHPSWGHSGFQLADFNGDGRMDLLVTNGDNADFNTSPTKPFHGVRIYLASGPLRFEEAWFFHLNGAYKPVARDFDLDGDLDLAVVSFFPDYERSPRESFVYFENRGGLEFEPSTFAECIAGRWLTLDAGDLDGDGDEDLALASLIRMPTPVPEALKKTWEEAGPSVMLLRNTTRRPAPPPPAGLRAPTDP